MTGTGGHVMTCPPEHPGTRRVYSAALKPCPEQSPGPRSCETLRRLRFRNAAGAALCRREVGGAPLGEEPCRANSSLNQHSIAQASTSTLPEVQGQVRKADRLSASIRCCRRMTPTLVGY